MNSHVDFQLGRSVTRKTTLVALVTFLFLRRKIDDLKLAVHIDIDFLQLLLVRMFLNYWRNNSHFGETFVESEIEKLDKLLRCFECKS